MSSEPAAFDFSQTVEGSFGFAQRIKTSKVNRWYGLIGNQDCKRTKGASFIEMGLTLDVMLIVFITKGTPCKNTLNPL